MPYGGIDRRSVFGGGLGTAIDMAVGERVIWHQFVSAVSGATFAGISPKLYYKDQVITAQFFGLPGMNAFISQEQTDAGTVYASRILMSSHEHIRGDDRLTWNGELYRVDGLSIFNKVNQKWMVPVKKGK